MKALIIVLAAVAFIPTANANGTKHCINLTTGDIITIRAGFPCPFPTTEY